VILVSGQVTIEGLSQRGQPNLTVLLTLGHERQLVSMQVSVWRSHNPMQDSEFGLPAAGKSQKEISR